MMVSRVAYERPNGPNQHQNIGNEEAKCNHPNYLIQTENRVMNQTLSKTIPTQQTH